MIGIQICDQTALLVSEEEVAASSEAMIGIQICDQTALLVSGEEAEDFRGS